MWTHQKHSLCAEAQLVCPVGTEAGLTFPRFFTRVCGVVACGETNESVSVCVRGFVARRRAVSKKLVFLDLVDGPLSAPPEATGVCLEVMCKFPRLAVEDVQSISRSVGVLDFIQVVGVVERAPPPTPSVTSDGIQGGKSARPGGSLTLHASSVEVLATHTSASEWPLLPDFSGPPVAAETVCMLRTLAKQVSDQAAFVALTRSRAPACAVSDAPEPFSNDVASAPASTAAPSASTSAPALASASASASASTSVAPAVCLGWLRGSCPSPCPRSLRHSFASAAEETRLRARQDARAARVAAEESADDPYRGKEIVKGSKAAAVLQALDRSVAAAIAAVAAATSVGECRKQEQGQDQEDRPNSTSDSDSAATAPPLAKRPAPLPLRPAQPLQLHGPAPPGSGRLGIGTGVGVEGEGRGCETPLTVCRLPKALRGGVFALWLLAAGPGLRHAQGHAHGQGQGLGQGLDAAAVAAALASATAAAAAAPAAAGPSAAACGPNRGDIAMAAEDDNSECNDAPYHAQHEQETEPCGPVAPCRPLVPTPAPTTSSSSPPTDISRVGGVSFANWLSGCPPVVVRPLLLQPLHL